MTKTVYVVTPCFNAVTTIDRTIQSVLSQAGDVRIRYHVQDGGSTDGTVERLEYWKRSLASGTLRRQCQGIRFTYGSAVDRGMYDAIVKGVAAVEAAANSFLTWINADDILMPGALALAGAMEQQFTPAELSWFGGSACILRDDMVTLSFDRPVTREVLRLGLCDGKTWDYLQQEGTFFRKWLWDATNPAATIAGMKLAGDWNLWRLMATKAGFAQIQVALGGFRISAGQLSASQRDTYTNEMNALVPEEERRKSFEQFCASAPVTRRRLKATDGSRFSIIEETVDGFARHRYQTVFGKAPPWGKRPALPEKTLMVGKAITFAPVEPDRPEFPDITPVLKRASGLFALDTDWQFPAVTEQHAYLRLIATPNRLIESCLYVAYPWATLIDKLHSKADDRDLHLDRFEQFCALLPQDVKKVTVCQHIHGRKYLDLFRQAGIQDVFWSHATHDDVVHAASETADVRLHPFPLFPVQTPQALPEAGPAADAVQRPYLFSFIGARANKYYLTEARNWILDHLAEDTRGLIIGRDGWHYQKVVYDLQIKGSAGQAEAPALVDASASDQFRNSLLQSTFSLCPAGSGPNSIRLWESLGAGSIPVILADTWAPPGDKRLWDMAAVFCKETPEDIKALPDRLAEIAADPARLMQMRHAMRQLWLLYGPQSFVTDVQEFLLDHAATAGRADAADILDTVLARGDGLSLLQVCAGALLLDPEKTQARIASNTRLATALEKARASQPADSALALHYDNVLDYARRKAPVVAPHVHRQTAPKICLYGRHANRTPLSYAPIRQLIGDQLQDVEAPEQADLVITGFNVDLRDNIETLQPLLQAPKAPKIAVISEEPLWDVTWSGPFTGRAGKLSVKGFEIPYTFLGHETSDIYDFEQIPYFVLTSNTYAVRYANLMARFATLPAADLLQRWQTATIPAAFCAENRKGDIYANTFPERDVAALSAYRTEVAEQTTAPNVLRLGKGWGTEAPRQSLPDWHLDKLAQLDGRTRVLSAFENVHQGLYISEKIFDAFAIGAIPTYWASPNHRVFDLVPAASMLNCHALSAQEAAQKIAQFTPDPAFAEAWLATTARLAALFGNGAALQSERQRVADATLKAVLSLV